MTRPIAASAAAVTAGAPGKAADPALAKAAHAFEAVFLRQMIGSMRQAKLGSDDDQLFDTRNADQFRDMADSHLADDMAGKFGIAALLTKQLGAAAAPASASASASASAAPSAPAVPLPGDPS